jgi:hypothetical protein
MAAVEEGGAMDCLGADEAAVAGVDALATADVANPGRVAVSVTGGG